MFSLSTLALNAMKHFLVAKSHVSTPVARSNSF